ncbi:hypothetical protein IKF57_00915 [Candidatus Saccharibacteria bacterium]|nr:hypothetical protein [Candidatus Saccharibacteria bacterium]
MKKYIWLGVVGAVILAVITFFIGRATVSAPSVDQTEIALPTPELTDGIRGEQFGIDKNINEDTIDNYLNRKDSVYRDMRMLKDPGNYEAIGGDSYLSGFVNGFEVVPFPYIVNVTGLPAEVGKTYTGPTLFTEKDGEYTANYQESMPILEALFPKDKNIFLMCGGGGYAGMMKNLLVSLGWDANKIYNVGGYWYYNGKNNINVRRDLDDDTVKYDFYKVPYHDINFKDLQKI